MAENGQDICVTKVAPTVSNYTWTVVNKNEICSGASCCWISNNTYTGCNKNIINSGYECGSIQCTRSASTQWCERAKDYDPDFPFESLNFSNPKITDPRLLTRNEYNRIVKQAPQYLGTNGLDMCFET